MTQMSVIFFLYQFNEDFTIKLRLLNLGFHLVNFTNSFGSAIEIIISLSLLLPILNLKVYQYPL